MTLEDKIELTIVDIIHKNAPILENDLYKIIEKSGVSSEARFSVIEKFRLKRYTSWIFAAGYESNKAPQEGGREYFTKRHQTAKVILTEPGLAYLKHLNSEKDKEDLDFKLKNLSLKQNVFQQRLTVASLLIAALAIFTPFVIWKMDKDDIKTTKTEVPQLQKVVQWQEQLSKDLKALKPVSVPDTGKRK